MPRPTSFRLPETTLRQLAELASVLGMTVTQAVIVIVDRAYHQEASRDQHRDD